MNKCAEENQFVLRFIETYQCLPALWNLKVEAYCNRDEKAKQYQILLEMYRKRYPNATLDDVKRKINTLRTNYRREKLRLEQSSRSGAGSDDSQEPNLFYFNEMHFINDVDTPCTSRSSTGNLLKETVKKVAKRKPDAAEALVEIATKKFTAKEKSPSEAITQSWAVNLDRMTREQRILCEKFIEDILFEGQMGSLHRNSLQLNTGGSFPTPLSLSQTNSPTTIQYSDSAPRPFRSNSSTPVHFDNSSNHFNYESESSPTTISEFFSSFNDC